MARTAGFDPDGDLNHGRWDALFAQSSSTVKTLTKVITKNTMIQTSQDGAFRGIGSSTGSKLNRRP